MCACDACVRVACVRVMHVCVRACCMCALHVGMGIVKVLTVLLLLSILLIGPVL